MRVIVGLGPSRGPEAPDKVRAVMRQLYNPVVRTNDRLLFCDSRSAELCKYASNAYLAMRVSFINDIANLCERVGGDVEMVRRGMGMDARIGPSFLFPGMGYGGSCFPKDTQALLATARRHNLELPLIEATERTNARQRVVFFDKLLRYFGAAAETSAKPLTGKIIAVWGLAFKPETDDVREAPALALIARLCQAGALVRASDPAANDTAALACSQLGLSDHVSFFSDAYEAAETADALVLCTEWRQYRQPNFRRLQRLLRGNGLFDGRNIWDRDQLRELGFRYYGIGR
jgi:UDPglucose 6-dehydrogenase